MENYILLAYLASAILAIVIYVNKARKQKQIEEQIEETKERHAAEMTRIQSDRDTQIEQLLKKIDDTDEARLLRNQLASLKEQLAQATEVLGKAEVGAKWLAERPQLEAERKEMEQALARLALELEEATRKLVSSQSEVDGLNKRIRELAAELARMESERALLADELQKLGAVRDEANKALDAVNGQIEKAREQLEELGRDVPRLESKKTQLEIDCTELDARKTRLSAEIELLNKKIEDLNQEIERLNKNISTLGPKAQEYDSKAQALGNLDELVKSTQGLQGEIAKTNKQMLDDLKAITELRKKGHVTLRQAAFKGLVENPPFTMPSAERPFDSETKALENLTRYIREDRQYDLPDRLLYAFHASLKTSDISSLTVMAGVSGTGKSALPDLYAKAMGIHMVMLSVEPRWDSPKDLMGFFNYVTNRYEATPLARALFQFQGHHNQEGLLPNPDLKDYMLMAMLDEMNLARIEYYFSEFLSKLELRRGGDMENEAHRRKVAMGIFAGAAGVEKNEQNKVVDFNEPYIDLFANYNTLFVGTMNEDETTQSLSDKVIDRANVLYFGRPPKLKAKTADVANQNTGEGKPDQKMKSINDTESTTFMKMATWQKWLKVVNENDLFEGQRLHEPKNLLHELNGYLGDLGRPFAHRSYGAMFAYIENYPYKAAGIDEMNDTLNFYKRPLADQIGMRVMPKLRGLDLSQHRATLDKVDSIVNKVDDETLKEAFKKAKSNGSGFFHWQGLNWAHGENQ